MRGWHQADAAALAEEDWLELVGAHLALVYSKGSLEKSSSKGARLSTLEAGLEDPARR